MQNSHPIIASTSKLFAYILNSYIIYVGPLNSLDIHSKMLDHDLGEQIISLDTDSSLIDFIKQEAFFPFQ